MVIHRVQVRRAQACDHDVGTVDVHPIWHDAAVDPVPERDLIRELVLVRVEHSERHVANDARAIRPGDARRIRRLCLRPHEGRARCARYRHRYRVAVADARPLVHAQRAVGPHCAVRAGYRRLRQGARRGGSHVGRARPTHACKRRVRQRAAVVPRHAVRRVARGSARPGDGHKPRTVPPDRTVDRGRHGSAVGPGARAVGVVVANRRAGNRQVAAVAVVHALPDGARHDVGHPSQPIRRVRPRRGRRITRGRAHCHEGRSVRRYVIPVLRTG